MILITDKIAKQFEKYTDEVLDLFGRDFPSASLKELLTKKLIEFVRLYQRDYAKEPQEPVAPRRLVTTATKAQHKKYNDSFARYEQAKAEYPTVLKEWEQGRSDHVRDWCLAIQGLFYLREFSKFEKLVKKMHGYGEKGFA